MRVDASPPLIQALAQTTQVIAATSPPAMRLPPQVAISPPRLDAEQLRRMGAHRDPVAQSILLAGTTGVAGLQRGAALEGALEDGLSVVAAASKLISAHGVSPAGVAELAGVLVSLTARFAAGKPAAKALLKAKLVADVAAIVTGGGKPDAFRLLGPVIMGIDDVVQLRKLYAATPGQPAPESWQLLDPGLRLSTYLQLNQSQLGQAVMGAVDLLQDSLPAPGAENPPPRPVRPAIPPVTSFGPMDPVISRLAGVHEQAGG